MDSEFLLRTEDELKRALAKFPVQSSEVCMIALTEEVGEAAQAFLHLYHEGKGSVVDYRAELVQVAAMAYRLFLETEK